MRDVVSCPRCGAARGPLDPEGLCPGCVLHAGLAGGESSAAIILDGATSDVRTLSSPTIGSAPRVWLREAERGGDSPAARPFTSEMPARGVAPGRYEFVGEIARGGMGAVLRGRDVELGRDLAVKVLLEAHRGVPELTRRFIEEAQIAGQLQHPGVVPVYELGSFADHRPYFAMKLVKGRTLAELLGERGEASRELPRFLAIFGAVCQTMAYVHARGVIHRDLKPSNVMVGAFGEVQVMDWGIAKVLPRAGLADEEPRGIEMGEGVIRTVRSGSDTDASHIGSVFGTPAYMAPEQARGEHARVDERADVFGLGSILCAILTGSPAFAGRSHAESLRRAGRAELGDALAGLDGSGADPELLALARACLAAEPEARPRDAQEVSARMTTYLAGVQDRLRRSELARAETQARAVEERRRHRAEVGLAIAGLVLVVLGGGGWFAFDRIERHWRQRTAAEMQAALDDANRLEGEARGRSDPVRWGAAVAAAERAEGILRAGRSDAAPRSRVVATLARLRGGQRESKERAAAEARDERLVEDLEEARLRMADLKGEEFDRQAPAVAYRELFLSYGIDVAGLPEAEAAARLSAVPGRLRVPLAATLDDWSSRVERPLGERLSRLAEAIDPDQNRSPTRAAMIRRDLAALRDLARRDAAQALPPATLTRLGATLRDLGAAEEAAALLRRGRARHPGDFWINYQLGYALYLASPPQFEEAIRFWTAALALRPGSPAIHTNLGNALGEKGRLDEAIAEQRRAIELKPDFAKAHNNLGKVPHQKGLVDEAMAEFRVAIALNDSALAHSNLGRALRDKGRLDEAEAENRRAIVIWPEGAEAYCNLSAILSEQGRFAEALAAMERGHELGSKRTGWGYPSGDWVRQARGQVELDGRVAAVLKRGEPPRDPIERIALTVHAQRKGWYATATREWQKMFADHPHYADELRLHYRWWAVRTATLAGLGKGKDDPPIDEETRVRLMEQAINWLDADLAARRKVLDGGSPQDRAASVAAFREWKTDPELSGLRDQETRSRLSEAQRQRCRRLWAEVDSLLANAAVK